MKNKELERKSQRQIERGGEREKGICSLYIKRQTDRQREIKDNTKRGGNRVNSSRN